MHRLHCEFGITGKALDWFRSYLANRFQSVRVGDHTSSTKELRQGVPQGSVLGPILFGMYTTPLANIIQKHKLHYHMYADDTQLYVSATTQLDITICVQLENCVHEIKQWLFENKLKMNDEKTELIVFCAKQNMPMDLKIKIGDSVIEPTSIVKNLGIKMDYQLNMESHVNYVLKSAYMNLRNIGRIRKFLTGSATKSLVHAYILSKIDYGNSLLVGIPNKLIAKLKRLQNMAARVITKTKRCEHVTPILKQLHWLPVKRRIEFKILVLTYKCVAGIAPGYLC